MEDSFELNIKTSLMNSVCNEVGFTRVEDVKHISDTLSSIIMNFKKYGQESTSDLIRNKSTQILFEKLGIDPEDFFQYLKASVTSQNATSYLLQITELAGKLLKKLIKEQSNSCWYLSGDQKGFQIASAWDTATCIYSMHKISQFLRIQKDDFISPSLENLTNIRVKKALDWLFQDNVLVRSNGRIGWNNNVFFRDDDRHEAINNNSPCNVVTAYVLNIVLRVQPTLKKSYESILISTILDSYNDKENCWTNCRDEIDLITTSYCLRALSAYFVYCSDTRTNPVFALGASDYERIIKIRKETAIKLSMVADPSLEFWRSQIANQTNATTTALCSLALRSCGLTESNPLLKRSTDWLLNNLEYYDGNWCWTQMADTGKRKSIRNSSVISSAIIKSNDYQKISKLNGVFLWLIDEIKEKLFNDGQVAVNTYAPLLCVFTEFLRFFHQKSL